MNEILDHIDNQDKKIRNYDAQNNVQQMNQANNNAMMNFEDQSIIKEQLDLKEDLRRISNLVRGRIEVINDDGETVWEEPTDKKMIIFTPYGIQKIIQFANWYLNKNTLLSNYDDTTIAIKMEDLAESFADNMFMKYDEVFAKPTFEDCKQVFLERRDAKIQLRQFAYEVSGENKTEEEVQKEVIGEMEVKIEREFENIRNKLMKDKLKEFELIVRVLQDAIHSAYQRAWKGQERTTIRQRIMISENRGGEFRQQNKSINPFKWGKE